MGFSIELLFNPTLESRVRKIASGLREGDRSGMIVTDDVKARPHITLCICEQADEGELEACVRRIAEETPTIPIGLASVGVFPGDQNVVFLAPIVNEELLEMHRRLHAQVHKFSTTPWVLYTPARWVPHCTLVTRLPKSALSRVVDSILELTFPISGEIVEVGVMEFTEGRVQRVLFTAMLG